MGTLAVKGLSGQPGKIWYIPVFPVTQPKSGKVRLVFDSAASYRGTSLNGVLLSGPDQNNRLQGTLLRFRERPIAFVGDVEAMFHSFYVEPYHRDFLRFFWFANNDPTGELVQYRSNVHIFGNTSSPAVAIFGLRKAAELYSEQHGDNQKCFYLAKRFIQRNFYVDDALGCANSVDDAVGILK